MPLVFKKSIVFKRSLIALLAVVALFFGRNIYCQMRWNGDVGISSSLYEKGEYDQAISVAREMLTIDPHMAETHAFLSRCYFKKGDRLTAQREINLALNMDPGVANHHHGYLVALNQRSHIPLQPAPRR